MINESSGVRQDDFAEPGPEAGAEDVCMLQRDPPTSPSVRGASVGWALFAGTPLIGQVASERHELEEVPLMHFGLGGPHVVPLDTQGSDDSCCNAGLLENFTGHRDLGVFAWLDRPGRDLNAGEFDWSCVPDSGVARIV